MTRKPPQYQHHVYGKSGAFEVYDSLNKAGQRVVCVDCAKASSQRRYDWQNKIMFMCTLDEMGQLCAVLLSYSDGVQFKFHGPAKDKSLAMRFDPEGNLLLEMNATGFATTVRIQSVYDRLAVTTLFLRLLAENLDISITELQSQLQAYYARQ